MTRVATTICVTVLLLCASAAVMPAAVAGTPAAEQTRRPNVLVLMTDQQRFDALSCYGCRAVATPNLDRLAKEGVLFERCYAPGTICTPVRASLWTGTPLPAHGVYKLHDILPNDQVLLPKRLKELGYHTSLVGKLHISGLWHETAHRHPNDGFDDYLWSEDPGLNLDSPLNAYARWVEKKDPAFFARLKREGKSLHHFPAECHFSSWAAEATVDLIRNRDTSRPFFILMSLFDPHDPYYDHPTEYAAKVRDEAIPAPQPAPDDPATPEGVKRELDKANKLLARMPDFRNDLHALRKGYYASIALLDEQFGRVLDELDRQGLTDNTLVAFVSDHGDMLYDRGLYTKGGFFYDPSVRVPLLLRMPGRIPPGTRVASPVQHMDLSATILAAAGYDRTQLDKINPHSMDLLALVRQGQQYDRRRDWAVCLYRNSGYGTGGGYFDPPLCATMIYDGRYKLCIYHPNEIGGPAEGELYDMQADPREEKNLWRDPARAADKARLLQQAADWMTKQDIRLHGSRGGEQFRTSVSKEYQKPGKSR